jgi:hypothetical protein
MRSALKILPLAFLLAALSLAAQTPVPKGIGVLTFRAQPVAEPKPGAWRIVKVSGRGEALLERMGTAGERAGGFADLTRLAAAWSAGHSPAKLAVRREEKLLAVSAANALGDLTAFLATLDLRMDPWGALATFTGVAVGTETDGLSLGLARHDPAQGNLTAHLTSLREEKGDPVAEVSLRYPSGLAKTFAEKQLADRAAAFARRTGATIAIQVDLEVKKPRTGT